MVTKRKDPQHGVLRRTWQDSHLWCFFEATRARWIQRRMWQDPRALCCPGVDCTVVSESSGSGVITLSSGVWCCSSTVALGSVWRWTSRCDVIFFSWFPVEKEPCVEAATTTWVWGCWEVPWILVWRHYEPCVAAQFCYRLFGVLQPHWCPNPTCWFWVELRAYARRCLNRTRQIFYSFPFPTCSLAEV